MIEHLEQRIAPATFTFTDVDGDLVTVKSSKGSDDQLAAAVTLENEGLGQQLRKIDLSSNAAAFSGTSLIVTAKPGAAGGDGFVNVGYIDATGADGGTSLDLGNVTVRGDLGRIIAGDANTATPGLGKFLANSIGNFGTTTQGIPPLLTSVVSGAAKSFFVRGDVVDAALVFEGDSQPGNKTKMGQVTIRGSLIGESSSNGGTLTFNDDAASIKIFGNIIGGLFDSTGRVTSTGDAGDLFVGGSLIGGSGEDSGSVEVASAKKIFIRGDMVGSSSAGSGSLTASTISGKSSLNVGGSLTGGDGQSSGSIVITNSIGNLIIGSSVEGGNGALSGTITGPASGATGDVSIGGSLLAGSGASSGSITELGSKLVRVGGDVTGGIASSGVKPILNFEIGGSLDGGNLNTIGLSQSISIAGDIRGSDSILSGVVSGSFQSVFVGGSVLGGTGDQSGAIGNPYATLGKVVILGSVIGGSGELSGRVVAADLATLAISGSLIGGSNDNSGQIRIDGTNDKISIRGDIRGGSASGASSLTGSGFLTGDQLGEVLIGGSLISGVDATTGLFLNNGAIRAADSIDALAIKGSLQGNSSNPAIVTAANSLGALAVEGNVTISRIVTGYSTTGTLINGNGGTNADATIGPVRVAGNWVASDLAAGANDGGDGFGNNNDSVLSGGSVANDGSLASAIASVTIDGYAMGVAGGIGSFGFTAQNVGLFNVGGTSIAVPAPSPLPVGPPAVPVGPTNIGIRVL